MELNEKITEILKKHVEGKEFFDALDYMIRSDASILKIYLDFVTAEIINNNWVDGVGIVLTGEFGHALYNNYAHELHKLSSNIILVSGGLRKPDTCVELYVNRLYRNQFVLFDDSIYSGNTAQNILQALHDVNSNVTRFLAIYTIYDGSRNLEHMNIKSLFKYHK